jgi:hypothetical protein
MFPRHPAIDESVRIEAIVQVVSAHMEAQRDRLCLDTLAELQRIFNELRRLRDALRRRESGAWLANRDRVPDVRNPLMAWRSMIGSGCPESLMAGKA